MKLSASSGPTDDISALKFGTVTVDPQALLAGSMADVAAAFNGVDVASTWMVLVSPQSDLVANLGITSVRVSADNQITLRFSNPTILSINQGSITFAVLAVK